MIFIEVHFNEDQRALEKLVLDAYMGQWAQVQPGPPPLGFGRVILWSGRMFQELQIPKGLESCAFEDLLFKCSSLPRARMQVGSMSGEVFTTPPENEDELAARICEGGRCGREYMVRPFHYGDFHDEP
jgi:hypothetical protein